MSINLALEPTPNSLRSCVASAIGRGSLRAFGFHWPRGGRKESTMQGNAFHSGSRVFCFALFAMLILARACGILVAPLAAEAPQRAKLPRIGIIEYSASWGPFLQGLRDLGYTEGHTIAIEYRHAEGKPDRLVEVASELVRLQVDVIMTWGTPATLAAKQATQTIPIVMLGVAEPLRTGLVASLARPGRNITGLTTVAAELGAKRLQLLLEVVP
jgi:ABC-type uncharacterized transport system substrate-binding protein